MGDGAVQYPAAFAAGRHAGQLGMRRLVACIDEDWRRDWLVGWDSVASRSPASVNEDVIGICVQHGPHQGGDGGCPRCAQARVGWMNAQARETTAGPSIWMRMQAPDDAHAPTCRAMRSGRRDECDCRSPVPKYERTFVTESEEVTPAMEAAVKRLLASEVTAPAELRPPPEHAGKPLHWLQAPLGRTGNHAGMHFVAEWESCDNWIMPKWKTMTSNEALADGYRYLGPAEWQNEETRQALAQANYALQTRLDRERSRLAQRIAELEATAKVRAEAFVALSEIHNEATARIATLEAENVRLREAWWLQGMPARIHTADVPGKTDLASEGVPSANVSRVLVSGMDAGRNQVSEWVEIGQWSRTSFSSDGKTAKPLPLSAIRPGDGIPR